MINTEPLFQTSHRRIQRVKNFEELATRPFAEGINALCWQRQLLGDFEEVVNASLNSENMITLEPAKLKSIELSIEGRKARDILLEDLKLLSEQGFQPSLDIIREYPRDDAAGLIATDVYSFHVDRSPVPTDTYLCTYFGRPSEILCNEDAQQRVKMTETRAALLQEYGGNDDENFLEYLRECCYDLHYAALPHARPISLGLGCLWRLAVQYPESPVPACIHRAPATMLEDKPRLLLIS